MKSTQATLMPNSLYLRNYRCRAIALLTPPEESELIRVKDKLGIPDDEISWEIGRKGSRRLGMHFPVLKQDGTVDIGDNLSEISVPPKERSWVYVAPRFEKEARKMLSHVDALG